MKTKRPNSALSAFAVFKSKCRMEKNKEGRRRKKKSHESPVPGGKRTKSRNDSTSQSLANVVQSTSRCESLPTPSPKKKVKSPEVAQQKNLEADRCFSWMISPVQPSLFNSENWEQKPLLIKRQGKNYYKGLFSCSDFDKMLRNNHLEFNRNIDVVTYTNGEKRSHNPDGRAYAAVIWDYYQQGCSIRLLNPQTYSRTIWKLCSLLQEYFGSFVGTNMYLTPPGSQGFAPHYDDIEAFILQLEGRKQWKVYSPRSESEFLPRHSSKNFSQSEIGDPVLEVELEPGDLLYFPRGFIHQAKTPDSAHSLHITVSTFQKNTWGDLLKMILPKVLECAMNENVAYRQSLPRDYMDYVGLASTKECPEREQFFRKLMLMTKDLSKYMLTDSSADLMAKDFIHSALPPCLTEEEKMCSIHGNGEHWKMQSGNGNARVTRGYELKPDTKIRLIRKRSVRLLREDCHLRLYHSLENSRTYKERNAQYISVDWEYFNALEMIIASYPEYVAVETLPLENLEQQVDIASLLYDKGVVETELPLEEDSDSDGAELGVL